MDKLKIAITQGNYNGTSYELIFRAFEEPTMLELCTPIIYGSTRYALAYRKALDLTTNFAAISQADDAQDGRLSIINAAEGCADVEMGSTTADSLQQEEASLAAATIDLNEGRVDALVLTPTAKPMKCPAGATEILLTEKAHIMPLSVEPKADDVIRLHGILERDFDLPSPRIAIVAETPLQDSGLADKVTAEHGIITYGPYTAEQILYNDTANHFDGIIAFGTDKFMQQLQNGLSQETSVRYFAGRQSVITAVALPAPMNQADKGLAKITELTQPIYTAIDIVRNRMAFDEARKDTLPKLFRDKRDERKQADQNRANTNTNTDRPEQTT